MSFAGTDPAICAVSPPVSVAAIAPTTATSPAIAAVSLPDSVPLNVPLINNSTSAYIAAQPEPAATAPPPYGLLSVVAEKIASRPAPTPDSVSILLVPAWLSIWTASQYGVLGDIGHDTERVIQPVADDELVRSTYNSASATPAASEYRPISKLAVSVPESRHQPISVISEALAGVVCFDTIAVPSIALVAPPVGSVVGATVTNPEFVPSASAISIPFRHSSTMRALLFRWSG